MCDERVCDCLAEHKNEANGGGGSFVGRWSGELYKNKNVTKHFKIQLDLCLRQFQLYTLS